jgi:hypothetical protein
MLRQSAEKMEAKNMMPKIWVHQLQLQFPFPFDSLSPLGRTFGPYDGPTHSIHPY